MNSKDVIAFFGGPTATGKALGIGHSAVCNWGEHVPAPRRAHVEMAMKLEQQRRDKEAKKAAKKAEREARKAEEARPGPAWPASAIG